MKKRKVIEIYKADNSILYDVQGAFYGNLVRKTTLYDLKTQSGYYAGSGRNDLYDDAFVRELENVLFARVDDPNGKVEAIKWGERFPWYDRVKSGLCVQEVKSINKEHFDTDVVTKRKLLELDYKKEL